MAHPLVTQLRFTRSELMRLLAGVSDADAAVRLLPMNCISWIVGHLANQENAYFVYFGLGEKLHPWLREQVGYGKPATTPLLTEILPIWQEVTAAADKFLDTITEEMLSHPLERNTNITSETLAQILLRVTYHYWYHLGEAAAIRQMIGHTDLPEYVGNNLPPWQ